MAEAIVGSAAPAVDLATLSQQHAVKTRLLDSRQHRHHDNHHGIIATAVKLKVLARTTFLIMHVVKPLHDVFFASILQSPCDKVTPKINAKNKCHGSCLLIIYSHLDQKISICKIILFYSISCHHHVVLPSCLTMYRCKYRYQKFSPQATDFMLRSRVLLMTFQPSRRGDTLVQFLVSSLSP